ncbi:peptidase domain-containing ABC transporter [Psychroflexus planctonicus]|uniref:ABC transporter ATP-binding protein n=1 Tax=Psychroflexus planctonicus TaxID=1526575 RepID=A0ABQ1SDT2_9FLAO|nr:ATP-binding cassette domain-containing protein [Psychroflexus planctonicus]GGE25226.1 ABC transporter ATP-binding protein [Psychroflexus planctonicus]
MSSTKNNNNPTPLNRLFKLLKFELRTIYLILGYAAFAGVVSLSLPLGIQAIINFIQAGEFRITMIVLISLVLASVIFAGLLNYMQMRVAEDLQQRLFTKSSFEFIYRFPRIIYTAFGSNYPPELANRFFDTMTIQKGVPKMLIDFSTAGVQILFGLILLSFYHPFFILFGVFLVALMYVVFNFSAPEGVRTSLIQSKYKYETAHWIEEVARNTDSFKVSGSSKLASSKHDDIVIKYLNARENHFKILRLQFFKMIGFKVLVIGALLIIGGLLVVNQQMNIGQFVGAEVIVILMVNSVEKLILGLENVYDVLTGLEKIGNVNDLKLERFDGTTPFDPGTDLTIELTNLGLKYKGAKKKSLEGLNLTIQPKERIFIDGTSGSGKTTLLKVVSGLILPTEGDFFINDITFNNIQIDHYRSFVGHSLIGNFPFEGSIRDNITFNNPDVKKADLDWAIEKLNLGPFIKSQSLGIDTNIATQGRNIPYTVAKKIMLARAIVTKPKLLVLKDPLVEFQDGEIDEIMDFLFEPTNPWAIIVVSRNSKWISKCDRKIYLDKGKIVES